MKLMLPIPVVSALKKLGKDIQVARKRRRIATQLMAERAGISRSTLVKIEKGEPGVSLGHYASVLFVLGAIDRIAKLIDVSSDTLGLDLEEDHLPQRIRTKKRNRKK